MHPLGVVSSMTYIYLVPSKKEKQPLSVTHPELAKESDGWDPAEITAERPTKGWRTVIFS